MCEAPQFHQGPLPFVADSQARLSPSPLFIKPFALVRKHKGQVYTLDIFYFESYGFDEIWIADYTCEEAYGAIDLFCLHPPEWWGYYERHGHSWKSYG